MDNKETLINHIEDTPVLRFKEFKDKWSVYSIKQLCDISTGKSLSKYLKDDGKYFIIDMGSITKDSYINAKKKTNIITVLLNKGDIVMPKDDIGNGSIICKTAVIEENNKYVLGDHVYRILVKSENPYFVSLLINSPTIHNALMKKVTGSAQLGININSVLNQKILIPSLLEQEKISNLFKNMDNLIKFHQHKLILLNKYKEGLIKYIFDRIYEFPNVSLQDICSIKTGKLDANAMTTNGQYKFFTCAKQDYLTDTFAFDGDAILISGNGNVGYSKFYSGKFNAYQRTYVLMNFKGNPIYIKVAIDVKLKNKINKEVNLGAMPFIKLKTLANLKIVLPSIKIQNKIAKILSTYDSLIDKETQTLNQLKSMKVGLLQQMFI